MCIYKCTYWERGQCKNKHIWLVKESIPTNTADKCQQCTLIQIQYRIGIYRAHERRGTFVIDHHQYFTHKSYYAITKSWAISLLSPFMQCTDFFHVIPYCSKIWKLQNSDWDVSQMHTKKSIRSINHATICFLLWELSEHLQAHENSPSL